MINGSVKEEDITFINIYAPHMEVPKYIKEILRDKKGETDSNTTIVGTLTPHWHQGTDHPDRKSIRQQWS